MRQENLILHVKKKLQKHKCTSGGDFRSKMSSQSGIKSAPLTWIIRLAPQNSFMDVVRVETLPVSQANPNQDKTSLLNVAIKLHGLYSDLG